jgi:ribosomal protein L39E
LLDVDGVLNAVTGMPDRRAWRDWEFVRATAGGELWPIWYSPTVVSSILRVHEEGLAEVRWLSTWGEHANGELRELLGLPKLVVAGTEPRWARSTASRWEAVSHGEFAGGRAVDPLTGQWWKFDVVRALHASDPERRIIWADDDLRRNRSVRVWMRMHTRSLVIGPRSDVGLTPKMIERINAYCGAKDAATR